jgi:carbon monoxide dehydrogenase subunit G
MSSLTIDRRFSVEAPPDRVWAYLTDPSLVVTCLPGAALVSSSEDGLRHEGTVAVKLGSLGVTYRGTAEFTEVDAERRRLRLRAKGREKAGGGSADMTMTSGVIAAGTGSEVTIEASVTVTGKIVALGRGMIEVVSEQLLTDFTTCLSSRVSQPVEAESHASGAEAGGTGPGSAAPAAVEPANALSIFLRALWARLKRLFGPS